MRRDIVDLSICIVSWNTSEKLRECLQSIYRHTEGLNIEVLIFDNASSDNTVEMIKNNYPQVILIDNQTNIGFGRGNNALIIKSKGKYILLINPDIIIIEPCFKKMIGFLKANPQAGVVGCKLVNMNGSIQKSYFEKFPTPISELFWGMMLHKIYNLSIFHTKKNITSDVEVAWLVGGCMLFRRDILKTIKGFDERYFMYGEDLDLCFRLRKMDLKVYYLPKITMLHYHGSSSKKQKKRYYAAVLQRESVYKFMKNHYGKITALSYRYCWIFSGIFRVFLSGIAYMVSMLMFNQKKHGFFLIAEKYSRIISWGLGFEKWTRNI